MFAGIVRFDRYPLLKGQKEELKRSLSRKKNGDISEYNDNNSYFVRLNTAGLSSYPGIFYDDQSCSIMAGEPLLSEKGIKRDHEEIACALKDLNLSLLSNVRGVFCAVTYENITEPLLTLCSDKLGIRPLYYWTDGSMAVFATALRILEKLSFIPKEINHRGVVETIGFGNPLGRRTQYENISILRESEVLSFSLNNVNSLSYWSWDKIKQNDILDKKIIKEIYNLFEEAIRIRLKGDIDALAFLSGGMDSRAIVAILKDLDVSTECFNFSPLNSQDQVFAKKFADKTSARIHLMERGEEAILDFRVQLAKKVSLLVKNKELNVTRPNALWSGDGGSVSVGSVYLDKEIVKTARSSSAEKIVDIFTLKNKIFFPAKILKNKKDREGVSSILTQGMLEELDRIKCTDIGQSLFLFLMVNDQRRHLNDFYEDLDIHRLEYQLPFFDSKFLELVFSLPLDYRLDHRFYTEWFSVFPDSVLKTPWQTYPGHVPCPLITDTENKLIYQWDKTSVNFRKKVKIRFEKGALGIKLALFSFNLGPVSRLKVLLFSLIHFFGLRDYAYMIKTTNIYKNFLKKVNC